jgi:hypothetical protein
MKRFLLSAVAAASIATGAGCYTAGDVGMGYSYGYATAGPDLYYLQPGVSVVAYADYPTFYADNHYWMWNNGMWYQSPYWGGGWSVAYNVPYGVRGIDRPYSYTRFRPGVGWQRAPRPAYQQGGTVRDHRTYRGGYNTGRTYNPPGNARDHRGAPPARGGWGGPPAQTPVRDQRAAPPPASSYGPGRPGSVAPPRSAPPPSSGPRYSPRSSGPTAPPPARGRR